MRIKYIGGCLGSSSKRFRTQASVTRNKKKYLKNAVLLKNPNFQGYWGTSR